MKETIKSLCLALLCVAALTLNSCKKSDSPSSKEKYLTSGTWTLRTVEYQKKDGTWENSANPTVYTLAFRDDKSVTAVTGTQVAVKAWNASDDFSQLSIVGTTGSGTAFTVNELSSSTLRILAAISSTVYTAERSTFTH